jgi:hypothetical protein
VLDHQRVESLQKPHVERLDIASHDDPHSATLLVRCCSRF